MPTVILESTVIAQGLPWPENLETALTMEAAVRAAGAEPATIAVLEGAIRVGLTREELETVARAARTDREADVPDGPVPAADRASRFLKANRRDLATAACTRANAATTVSATLWLARRFGPQACVMATGGLGGVHRGAAATFDVSTDLDELARADGCLVVCSGFKSILDLPATLEALETRGVAIVGFRTDELPAFTTRSSGLPLEHHVESASQAAELVRTHRALGLPGAIVLANPVPAEMSIPRQQMEDALNRALEMAIERGVAGKAITPFLLDSIRLATGGASLRANRALLVANARLAAEVAVALEGLPSATPGSGD